MLKKMFVLIYLCLWSLASVFGADEVKKVSVMEGDSVTLNPDLTQIQRFNQILWRFGEQGSIIAGIVGNVILYEDDEISSERLQLDQTGSLTIKNMRTKHSVLYKAKIGHSAGSLYTNYIVTVYESAVLDVVKDEMKLVSVMEGNPVTLQTDVTELKGDELIVWRSGDEGKLIAKHDTEAKSSPLYYDERFRDRLQLDQTRSLIITNTRNTDSGLYTVKISSNKNTLYKRFTVTVSAVPDPGLSGGAVAGIVIVVLLVCAAGAAAVTYYLRSRTTNLPSQTWSVPAGDDVSLNPETEIKTSDEILWLFGPKDTLIAEIKRETREMTPYLNFNWMSKCGLKLDEMTGSLTFKGIEPKHSGLYTLKIRRGRETICKKFMVSVEDRVRLVTEGGDVTLYSNINIQKDDEVQWLFGDKGEQPIAEMKMRKVTTHSGADERFKDKLELMETGSLTITKVTSEHSGVYTQKIRRAEETLYSRLLFCVKGREIRAMEGETVTLEPDTEINNDELIRWLFIHEEQQTIIAEIRGEPREIFTHGDVVDGRFRDRLKLDKTGSLTITNTRTTDSGRYKLQIISSSGVSENIFFVTVKVEKKLLDEGDSVTLNSDTDIQRHDHILWMFGAQNNLIAQIKGGSVKRYDGPDERFRDRLQLDETGSLTITNIRTEHTGLYKLLIISSREILEKTFKVLIPLRYEVVTDGDPVALKTGLYKIQTADEIQWMFGDKNSPIAEIKGATVKTYDGPDERFRNRLKLNEKTGDLIINNSTPEHAGDYKLKICSSRGKSSRTYRVIIKDKVREKSVMKEKNDSTEQRGNESVTVVMPLLNGEDVDEVNEVDYVNVMNDQEGTSSL